MAMVGTVVWGMFATGALIRAFFRPTRAVVKDGAIRRCAGQSNQFGVCDSSDVVDTEPGEPVFSTGSGEVVSVGADYVNIVVGNDAVVLMYQGLNPSVEEGQHVGVGQRLGESNGRIFFSVTQFKPGMKAEFVAPSAWLAVRGQRLVRTNSGDANAYCAGGREIIVPDELGQNCNLKLPSKAGFALLPVTAELE